jgi:hypothetical protein
LPGDNRVVAMVVGTVIGAAIGSEDRPPHGQDRSLLRRTRAGAAGAGQTVSWTNPTTRVNYQLTPLDKGVSDQGCRKFRLVPRRVRLSEGRTTACAG